MLLKFNNKNKIFVNDKISAENNFVKYKLMYNFKQEKMNLENLNVVELNAQDALTIEGGSWFTDLVVEAAVLVVQIGHAGLGVAAGLRDGLVNGATEARN